MNKKIKSLTTGGLTCEKILSVSREEQEIKFKSPADARGHAEELNYVISHPDEEELTPEEIIHLKIELAETKRYLSECEEPLC